MERLRGPLRLRLASACRPLARWTRAPGLCNHGPDGLHTKTLVRRRCGRGTPSPDPPGGGDGGDGGDQEAHGLQRPLGLPRRRAGRDDVVADDDPPRPTPREPVQTGRRAPQCVVGSPPAARLSPDWSAARPGSAGGYGERVVPTPRAAPAPRGGDRPGRVVPAGPAPWRASTGPAPDERLARRCQRRRRRGASRSASGRRARAPALLVREHQCARTVPAYSAAAQGGASPVGTGVGQAGRAVQGRVASLPHSAVRGGRSQQQPRATGRARRRAGTGSSGDASRAAPRVSPARAGPVDAPGDQPTYTTAVARRWKASAAGRRWSR